MRANGVRTSWLTPAIHWVRAVSRRASISPCFCRWALVWLSFSATSPAKPSVGSCTGWPSASASSPAATVRSCFAPRPLTSRQTASPSASRHSAAGRMLFTTSVSSWGEL